MNESKTEIDEISFSLQSALISKKVDIFGKATKLLAKRKYFVSTLNSDTIQWFFIKIYTVLTAVSTGVKSNRVRITSTGSKLCGNTPVTCSTCSKFFCLVHRARFLLHVRCTLNVLETDPWTVHRRKRILLLTLWVLFYQNLLSLWCCTTKLTFCGVDIPTIFRRTPRDRKQWACLWMVWKYMEAGVIGLKRNSRHPLNITG